MEEISKVPLTSLVDMLATHTEEVMHMLREGTLGKEYEAGKKMIKLVTAEIERRKNATEKRLGTV